ncbi:MAG: magnesium transporter [Thermoprotei archaeon]|mgnify:CR=1 FL=1|nr:MAG: magnesium transporter [Thermoprotei archaeon]
MLCTVFIRAYDRIGLMRDIADVMSRNGMNILHSYTTAKEGYAYLLLVAEGEADPDTIKQQLTNVPNVVAVDVTEIPEYSDIFTELATTIVEYLERGYISISDVPKLVHPEYLTDILLRLDEKTRRRLYPLIPDSYYVEILHQLPPQLLTEVMEVVGVDRVTRIAAQLPVDNLADVISKLPHTARRELLRRLPEDKVREVKKVLEYPPDTAGGLMITKVPIAKLGTTVGEVLQEIAEPRKFESTRYVYVIDDEGRLVGYIPVTELLRAKRDEVVNNLARRDFVPVTPDVDQEVVAKIAARYDLLEVPVVDERGRFLGVVTIDDLVDVIISESSEDLIRFGGLIETRAIWRYMSATVLDLFKRRVFWLIALYVLEFLTAGVLKTYEAIISKVAALALFIPVLCDTGGNAGAQSASLVIRALAVGELTPKDFLKIVGKEAATALLLGLTLMPIASLLAYLLTQNILIVVSIALAVVAVTLIASLIGGLLPIVAMVLRVDPATISSPLITTISDICGLSVYFTIASKLLGLL